MSKKLISVSKKWKILSYRWLLPAKIVLCTFVYSFSINGYAQDMCEEHILMDAPGNVGVAHEAGQPRNSRTMTGLRLGDVGFKVRISIIQRTTAFQYTSGGNNHFESNVFFPNLGPSTGYVFTRARVQRANGNPGGNNTVDIIFDEPMTEVFLHFANIDWANVDFQGNQHQERMLVPQNTGLSNTRYSSTTRLFENTNPNTMLENNPVSDGYRSFRITPAAGRTNFSAIRFQYQDNNRSANHTDGNFWILTQPKPASDFGDAPDSYSTLSADDGPGHAVSECVLNTTTDNGTYITVDDGDTPAVNDDQPKFIPDPSTTAQLLLGDEVSVEDDGQPQIDANKDNFDDAVSDFPVTLTDTSYTLNNVFTTNLTDEPARLCGWIDFDTINSNASEGIGQFNNARGERACVTVPDVNGTGGSVTGGLADCAPRAALGSGKYSCTLSWTLPENFVYDPINDTYARFRIASNATEAESPTDPSASSANGEVEDYLIPGGTLPVSLSSFSSQYKSFHMHYYWTTDTELANLGYNFWIKQNGQWKQINEALVPGALTTIEANKYSHRISLNKSERQGGEIEAVAISTVSTSGREEMYGPYKPDTTYGYAGEAPQPVDWSVIAAEMDETLSSQGYVKVGQNWYRTNHHTGKRYLKRSANHGYLGQISVKSDNAGMVKLSHDALVNAGIDLTNQEVAAIALSYAGNPLAIDVENAHRDKWTAQSSLVFHTTGLESAPLDVTEMVYQLYLDYADHLLSPEISTQVSADTLTTVVSKVSKHEAQLKYSTEITGDDPWVAKSMVNYRGRGDSEHTFSHELANTGDGSGVMTVSFISAYDDRNTIDDGMITLYQDTADGWLELGSALYQSTGNHQADFRIDAGVLHEGVNNFKIKLSPVDGGLRYAYIHMDKTQLVYAATVDNQNSVSDTFVQKEDDATSGNYDATNIDAASKVYAVLDYDQSMMEITVTDGQLQKLSSEFGDIRYYIVKDGGYLDAQINALPLPDASAISSDNADYLIISHPLFNESFASGSGNTFINHKQNAGHNVKVVNYSDIIQLTGYGISSETTLSAYIQNEKAANANLKYVLLAGSACRDTRDFTGNGCVNMIPTKYVYSSGSKQTPSDFRMGDVDGDGYADVVVSRLPARTQGELDNILAKMNANEVAGSNSEPLKAILSADTYDTGFKFDFTVQQQRIAANLPEGTETVSVFADDGANKQSMMDALNDGADIWSYSGHSSMYRLGGGVTFLDAADGAALTNNRYPFAMPLACYMTYSVHESVNTLSYQLMNNPNGVSGVFGSSVLTSFNHNEILQKEIVRLMNSEGLTLGEAILQAQRRLPASSGTVAGANMMGDPAAKW